jgi:hypothetical protein
MAALAAVFSFFIPALLVTNYTLNHFYVLGGYMLDSGWFAYLATHASTWPLPNPPAIGGTYFSTHFSPVFYILTALFKGLPLSNASVFFSLTQGFWFGLIGLAVCLLYSTAMRGGTVLALGCLSVLAALNGISLSILGFPHVEIAIPALLLLFFAFYVRGWSVAACMVLACGLMMREDAGLHYFCVFVLLGFALRCCQTGRKHAREFFLAAGICCVYSICAVTVQKFFFAAGDNALARIYLGSPAFAHLGAEFFFMRLRFLAANRLYVLAPLAVIVLAGAVRRDALLLAGPLACIPWLAVSFAAVTHEAGTLTDYYAFPAVVPLLWPACAQAIRQRITGLASSFYVLLQIVAIALSLGFFLLSSGNHDPAPWRSFLFQYIGRVAPLEAALGSVFEHSGLPGRFIVDDAVASLRPGAVTGSQWKYALNFSRPEIDAVDMLVFQPNTWADSRKKDIAAHANLENACRLTGTDLWVLSRRPLELDFCEAPVLPVGAVLPADEPALTCMRGWSGIEDKGRWTVGSQVSFPPFAEHSFAQAKFCIDGKGFLAAPEDRLVLSVIADGRMAGEMLYSYPDRDYTWQCVSFSPGADAADGIKISLRVQGFSSPRERGLSADGRQLGVFVRSFGLFDE